MCYNPRMIRLKRLYAHNFKQLQEVELAFPDSARILVQGRNEAGKSTLFEAIFFALFGSALASETGARGLDSLIAYETEKARVELDMSCGDRLFKITRTIVRAKSNTWELEICRDGMPPEEIRGNTAVNKRLVAELGFDGEALLNTCFVEQKKLEKLEGLSKAKREESLAKLLNLDAIVDLENDLKIRIEDRQELERLKKRADLAEIQAELPAREHELATVDSKLKLIDLRRAVEGSVTELQAVQSLEASICELLARRDAVAAQVERIEALKQAMVNVKQARDLVERSVETTREIERLAAERAEARRAADAGATLKERSRALEHLAHMSRRLGRIRAALDLNGQKLTELKAIQVRLDELTSAAEREQGLISELEMQLRGCEQDQALGVWMDARRAAAAVGEIDQEVQRSQSARDRLSRQFRIQVYGLAGLLLILVLAAAILSPWAGVFIALAALVLLVLAARVTSLWRDLAHAAEALGQAQGQVRAQAATNEMRMAQLHAAELRLVELTMPVPQSIESAAAQRQAIGQTLSGRTKEEFRAAQEEARERLVNARAVLGELQQPFGTGSASGSGLGDALARLERSIVKAEALIGRWTPRLDESARQVGAEANPDAVQRALYQLQAQAEQAQRRGADALRLDQEIARREKQAQSLAQEACIAYEEARRAKPETPEWSAAMALDDYTHFGKELRSEYNTLGGDAVVKKSRELEGELGRRQGERDTRAHHAAALVGKTQELLAAMGQADALSETPPLEELAELRARFQTVELGDEIALRSQYKDLVGRVHSLKDRQTQLERELGLEGEVLDRAACRTEYADKARQALVRERGVEIVSLARRRIVTKVLPATMDYMRQILPTLTRDRYHDAQLEPESYKIQVWDERAGQGGAFKEKNIFSGGTKDQFSLALRLAFALATLPQERGTAPSFIFLDEPLGSFDDERADALIYLLTQGEIARAFDQIFLISHVHVDERLFTHRVVLEHGRVQFTDLPRPEPSEAPPA